MGSDLTDANGDYDVTGLVDGTYRVEFQDDSRTHVREWYADAATLTLADDVVVGKSQTVADIDADLVAAGRIGGTVTGPDGLPVAQVMVTPYWLVGGTWEFVGEDLIDLFIYSDSSGRYEVKGLPAGVYRLEFLDIHQQVPGRVLEGQGDLADRDRHRPRPGPDVGQHQPDARGRGGARPHRRRRWPSRSGRSRGSRARRGSVRWSR